MLLIVRCKFPQTTCEPAQVDADKHRELGSRFDVKGFPTILYFARGKPVESHTPYASTAAVLGVFCSNFSYSAATLLF